MHTFPITIQTVILNLWPYCKHNLCSWDHALKRFPTLPVVLFTTRVWFVSASNMTSLNLQSYTCEYIIVVVCSRVCTWLTPWDASPTPPVIPLTASSASSLANQRDISVFSTATPSLPKLLNRYSNFIYSNSFYKPVT